MDFLLNEEEGMMLDMARKFAIGEVKPRARAIDRNHEFPADLVKQMADLGLLGIAVPEEYGGAGMSNVCYALAMEEISAACASTGVIMSVNNSLVCDPLKRYGSDAQKKKYLIPLATGKVLGCFALTESQAGSDAANQRTTAKLDGDHYIINGSKIFITNGKEADIALVFAMTDKEKAHRGISVFIVETKTPGFSVPKCEHKLGIHGSSTAELLFENMRIPKENLLGKEGDGFKIALSTLDGGRIGIAAQALGIARAALDEATEYANQRVQFGKPIASLQAIQWMIAEMATRVDAARLLIHRAAFLKDKGGAYGKESAMAKLYAAEAAMFVTTKAIQVFGGYGYTEEFDVERHFRDAKITEIYEGTSEVQKLVIAASILKG